MGLATTDSGRGYLCPRKVCEYNFISKDATDKLKVPGGMFVKATIKEPRELCYD